MFITETFEMALTDFANTESKQPVLIRAVASQLRYRWVGPPMAANGAPHVVIRERMDDPRYVRDRLVNIHVAASYSQGGRDLGGMGGSCKLYPREDYILLRRHAGDP